MIIRSLIPVAMVFAAGAAGAADRVAITDFSSTVMEKGAPVGWDLTEKTGKADLALVVVDSVPAVWFKSAKTSYSLQKKVKVDLKKYPILSWKWRAVVLPAGGDFRKTKTDDQAAQLVVAFSKTKGIAYIWDSGAPEGAMESTHPAPFFTVKVVVVRSGPAELGKWVEETRNVYEDYRKMYGSEPSTVSAMRLQINSQHTKTSGESYFGDVAFTAAPDPVPAAK
jgi:hypothetical protein